MGFVCGSPWQFLENLEILTEVLHIIFAIQSVKSWIFWGMPDSKVEGIDLTNVLTLLGVETCMCSS